MWLGFSFRAQIILRGFGFGWKQVSCILSRLSSEFSDLILILLKSLLLALKKLDGRVILSVYHYLLLRVRLFLDNQSMMNFSWYTFIKQVESWLHFTCCNSRIACLLFGMLIDKLSFHLERTDDMRKIPGIWNDLTKNMHIMTCILWEAKIIPVLKSDQDTIKKQRYYYGPDTKY